MLAPSSSILQNCVFFPPFPPEHLSSFCFSSLLVGLSMAQRKSKKPHHKQGNDALVWFAPVSGPLLSPGREKAIQPSRRKALPSSIFSLPPLDRTRRKQQVPELEEPTSPKVSCIGQVRASKKKDHKNDPFWKEEHGGFDRRSQPRAGSASPARFFTSPGRQLKWASLFGSRKEGSASPRTSGYGGIDASSCRGYAGSSPSTSSHASQCDISSRLGVPCESPSVLESFREGKSCGAFLARSFMLLQECSHHVPNDMASTAAASDIARDVHAHIQQRTWQPEHTASRAQLNSPTSSTAKECNVPEVAWEIARKHLNDNSHEIPQINDQIRTEHKPGVAVMDGTVKGRNSVAGGSIKISLDVVPETWLYSNGERLRPDPAHQLQCAPRRSGSSRDELLQDMESVSKDETCSKESGKMCVDGKLRTVGGALTSEHMENLTQECLHVQGPHQSDCSPGRQDYMLAFSEPKHKVDQIFVAGKDGLSVCNKNQTDSFSSQTPYGVILVGYKFQSWPVPINDKKQVNNESLHEDDLKVKGRVEVGRLSFQGMGTHSQWLKGEAEFIRSFSATSYRTVIRLRRCKSEPSRSS